MIDTTDILLFVFCLIGFVSMFWRIVNKYQLLEKAVYLLKLNPEKVCIMCITFWFTLLILIPMPVGLSYLSKFIIAFTSTPFIIELTRKEW